MIDIIITVLFGWTGYWRFKKGQKALGVVWLLTGGVFLIGWIIDIVQAYKICATEISPKKAKSATLISVACLVALVLIGGGLNKKSEPPITDGNTNQVIVSESVKMTETTEEQTTISTTESTTQPTAEKTTESYNEIQSIFMELSFDTTASDIESIINSTSLEHSKNKYNGYTSYRFAYTSGVAVQKYGDSGEYVSITFDNNSGTLMYAEYNDYENFVISLLYNYGSYYAFDFDNPQNAYSGYYYYKPGDSSKKGVKLKYDNGREHETSYISSLDAAEALRHPAYR